MKCVMCGGQTTSKRESYHYDESGLDVTLAGVVVHRCAKCDEVMPEIPKIEDLHRVIAWDLATKSAKLAPQEIRFLRKQLGFSGMDFAKTIGVAPETVSRWESGAQQMGVAAERFLRLMSITQSGASEYPLEKLRDVAADEAVPAHILIDQRRGDWRSRAVA